jgi:hypothetical protein
MTQAQSDTLATNYTVGWMDGYITHRGGSPYPIHTGAHFSWWELLVYIYIPPGLIGTGAGWVDGRLWWLCCDVVFICARFVRWCCSIP